LQEISRSIWSNLSRPDGDGMVKEADFGRLMPSKHARRAFELFDIDGSEFVTREEVCECGCNTSFFFLV
jgi:hypothetical protein